MYSIIALELLEFLDHKPVQQLKCIMPPNDT